MRGLGDLKSPHVQVVRGENSLFAPSISLLVGDIGLSVFEDKLSVSWPLCNDGDESAFRVISAFYRMIADAAARDGSDIALVDVGPNLGAINRAILIAADHVVIPLAPDLFSMQGLRNLGPALWRWREEWKERLPKNPAPDLKLPAGAMSPGGCVFMQHFARDRRPVQAFERWMQKIPQEYRFSVLNQSNEDSVRVEADPYCLARLKHYRSLMPMAMEARKPMFFLKPADGAIGAHTYAVQDCCRDFKQLAHKVAAICGIEIPASEETISAQTLRWFVIMVSLRRFFPGFAERTR